MIQKILFRGKGDAGGQRSAVGGEGGNHWEKGTNRSAFFRGEVDKYSWEDIGSSFLPWGMIAAFLYAQLENLEDIQSKRRELWAGMMKALETSWIETMA